MIKQYVILMRTDKLNIKTAPGRNWLLYILECSDNSLYTGITNRLDIRLSAHQNGTAARYTRGRTPVMLVYTEECSDRSNATKREYAVKKLSKPEKLELIKNYSPPNAENSF